MSDWLTGRYSLLVRKWWVGFDGDSGGGEGLHLIIDVCDSWCRIGWPDAICFLSENGGWALTVTGGGEGLCLIVDIWESWCLIDWLIGVSDSWCLIGWLINVFDSWCLIGWLTGWCVWHWVTADVWLVDWSILRCFPIPSSYFTHMFLVYAGLF